ncbi:hypothetical protein COCNU_12G000460 [Cocos nucifera]|uniref:Uncharacterized protein n=1 Tax=Cocos nucifera TaxID=13894 RepID=A0A8K0NA99_COCNU|nr:hypothetical protein COCNU_12G000460 [Cocos nucifera]
MDTYAIEKLTKGLYTQKKRKEKASDESSKWVKVSIFDSVAPTIVGIAPEVHPGDEVISIAHADVVEEEPLPLESVNLPSGIVCPIPLPAKRRGRKGKAAVAMKAFKERLDEPGRSNNEDQDADPFSNPNIIRDLTDRFTLPEEVDRLADLDQRQFIWKSLGTVLRAEINRLQAKAIETECLTEEKMAENKSLHSALQKKEFISEGLKAALALEEEEKKEARLKVAELEAQLVKSIPEAAARAVEEFKTFLEMKDLNIAFSRKAFIKGFKLCEGRVARRFPELDLGFLGEEEEASEEVGPSNTRADLYSVEPIVGASEPAQGPEAVESTLASSAAAPPKSPPLNQGYNPPSPIDANPLPQGVPLKPLIKSLKKEIHNLKKKLKKMEDDLHASWKNASVVTKEVTHL